MSSTLIPDAGPMITVTGSSVPGVDLTVPEVAPGDPEPIGALGDRYGEGAITLEQHATVIRSAAECVAPTWEGEAATSYQSLSLLVAGHFQNAAHTLRDASQTLKRYQAELARCKKEGEQAARECQHWIGQSQTDHQQLTTAQTDVTNDQRALTIARTDAAGARAKGPSGAAEAAIYDGLAAIAAGALADAQRRVKAAKTALDHDEQQLKLWQARGRRAWEEAEQAAIRATGSLLPLFIAPPPLAGIPIVQELFGEAPSIAPCESPDGLVFNSAGDEGGGLAAKIGGLAGSLAALVSEILGGAVENGSEIGDAIVSKVGRENVAQLIEKAGGIADSRVPGASVASQLFADAVRVGGPSAVRAGIELTARDLLDEPGLEKALEEAVHEGLNQLANKPPFGR
jgi:uncharacterized protein YukE